VKLNAALPATLALLFIATLAGLFRFWRLDEVPPGLDYDEAFNLMMALKVHRGEPPVIFFPENNGEEPIHIYLIALVFRLVGPTVIGGRLVSAGLGVATVLAQYLATAELFHDLGPARARRLALLGSLVLATWYWPVHFSRLGIEPVTVPAVGLPAVAFTWRAMRTGLPRDAALAGLFGGLSLYTYPAGRAIPLIAAMVIAVHFWRAREGRLRVATQAAGAAVIGLLIFLPLGIFFVVNPDWFFLRMGQVTVQTIGEGAANPPVSLAEGTLRAALGVFWRGDESWLRNLSGRPAYDAIQAVFALVGLSACFQQRSQRGRWFIPAWAAVSLIPTAVSEFAPQFSRAIGAVPPLAMLVAVGMWAAGNWLKTRLHGSAGRIAAPLVVGLGMAASTGWALRDYFYRWPRAPETYLALSGGVRAIAEYAARLPDGEPVYVSPIADFYYTLRYIVAHDARRVATFDGRRCLVHPSRPDRPTHVISIVWPNEDPRTPARLAQIYPEGSIAWQLDHLGKPYAQDFLIPPHAAARLPAELTAAAADMGRVASLAGHGQNQTTASPGDAIELSVLWEASGLPAPEHVVVVGLQREDGLPSPEAELTVLLQAWPCQGAYPTTRWQMGERIWDQYAAPLPLTLRPGRYRLMAGLLAAAPGLAPQTGPAMVPAAELVAGALIPLSSLSVVDGT
jgi:hypothetical protein